MYYIQGNNRNYHKVFKRNQGPTQRKHLLSTGNKTQTTEQQEKTYRLPIPYPLEIFFRKEVDIKTFSDEGKQKNLSPSDLL